MPLGFEASGEPSIADLGGSEGSAMFVADGSRLCALRLSTQRLLWTEVLAGTIQGSPRASNGRVGANGVAMIRQSLKEALASAQRYLPENSREHQVLSEELRKLGGAPHDRH